MRLKRIKIVNFGQFSNKTFDLPSDKIDVFFGANEAGKSTTVAFIKQILFGFHLRSNSSPFLKITRLWPMLVQWAVAYFSKIMAVNMN